MTPSHVRAHSFVTDAGAVIHTDKVKLVAIDQNLTTFSEDEAEAE